MTASKARIEVTNLWDNVTPANNQVFAYSAANRLTSASGPYGDLSWTYDGVGNRTGETLVAGGITTADTLTYPGTSPSSSQLGRKWTIIPSSHSAASAR